MSFWVLGSAGKKGKESGQEPKVKSGCQLSKKRNKPVAQTPPSLRHPGGAGRGRRAGLPQGPNDNAYSAVSFFPVPHTSGLISRPTTQNVSYYSCFIEEKVEAQNVKR